MSKISLNIPDLAANLRRLSGESSTNSYCSGTAVLMRQFSERKGLSFARRMIKINCTNTELAQWVDQKCRLLFPLCFLLFNVIYWTTVDV